VDYSYGGTVSYSGGDATVPVTSSWNAWYISCPSQTTCISLTSSSAISFSGYGGSGSGGNQIIQVLAQSGSSQVGSTVQVTLTAGSWNTYTVTASQLGVAGKSISGIQIQAYDSVKQSSVSFKNVQISNAACSSAAETVGNTAQMSFSELSVGMIAGIVAGALVVIGIVIAIIVVKKKRAQREEMV